MLSERPSSSEDEQKQANHNNYKLTQKFSQFAPLFLLAGFQPIRMHGIKPRKGDVGDSKYDQRFDNDLSHGGEQYLSVVGLSQEATYDKKSSQQHKVCYQQDDDGSECLDHSASL